MAPSSDIFLVWGLYKDDTLSGMTGTLFSQHKSFFKMLAKWQGLIFVIALISSITFILKIQTVS